MAFARERGVSHGEFARSKNISAAERWRRCAICAGSASAKSLVQALEQFIRTYEPHEAREGTVLFPAIRSIVSKHEFDSLGEEFERKEHQLFGEEGFEKMVDQVAGIEKRLGIYELAQFTPRA